MGFDMPAWDRPLAERFAAYDRVLAESKKTGRVCAACGQEIGPHPAYRARRYGDGPFAMMCGECAPEWLVSRRGKPMRTIPEVHVYEWDCAWCGRQVVLGMTLYQYRERVYCSDECRKAYARKAKRKHPQKKTCEVCGSEFVAKRSDAKTCSAACKQRAYRKRLQVSNATITGAP